MIIHLPQSVSMVIDKLEYNGFEAYIVGGCVRDSILGKKPKDYDIATSASPEQVKRCFSGYKIIDTGIKHGTVTVIADGEKIEVTTFRIDGRYDDRRHPSSVMFSTNIIDDLSRRDFTINSMAYNPRTGLIDSFGAQKDLFSQRIACVGEPSVRFSEDALRIMRALRFASVLGFEIEKTTAIAIHDMKHLLKDIAFERIASELVLLLNGNSPADILIKFADVFAVIIPEIEPCINFNQHNRYHVYDVWTHTAMAVEHSKPLPDVRLALMLHDIAKPQCFRLDDEGNGHFFNHERVGAEMAEDILRRLRFSNETIKRVCTLIKYHYVTPVDDYKVVKRLISTVGEELFPTLLEVMRGDNRAKQSFCFERVQTLEAMQAKAEEIIAENQCLKITDLDVDGNDILELGCKGPEVGEILNMLLDSVIEEKVANERNALIELARSYYSQ